MKKTFLTITLATACMSRLHGQLLLNDFTQHLIDFNGYTGAGFSPTPSAGQLDSDTWAATGMSDGNVTFGGTAVTGDFARGTSSTAVATGGFYSFTDPAINGGTGAFGIQPIADDWTPGTLTLKVQNNTGFALTGFNIQYEIWVRNDQGRANSLNFSYSLNDVSYTPVSTLDFTSPEAADALGFQKTDRSASVSVAIPDSSFFYLRWTGNDVSGSGSRDEFALDNIGITAVPEPHEYALLAALGLLGFAVYRRRALQRA
jgi:hypothetical protein